MPLLVIFSPASCLLTCAFFVFARGACTCMWNASRRFHRRAYCASRCACGMGSTLRTTPHAGNTSDWRWNFDACRAMRMSCVCAWWCSVCHAMCSCLRGRLLAECGLCGVAPVRRHGDVHGDALCGAHAGVHWHASCARLYMRGCDMCTCVVERCACVRWLQGLEGGV